MGVLDDELTLARFVFGGVRFFNLICRLSPAIFYAVALSFCPWGVVGIHQSCKRAGVMCFQATGVEATPFARASG